MKTPLKVTRSPVEWNPLVRRFGDLQIFFKRTLDPTEICIPAEKASIQVAPEQGRRD